MFLGHNSLFMGPAGVLSVGMESGGQEGSGGSLVGSCGRPLPMELCLGAHFRGSLGGLAGLGKAISHGLHNQ